MKLHKTAIVRILGMAFTALFLFSCECRRTASGNVLDISTQLPIDSVFVKGIERVYNEYYTNSEGEYYMTTGMIGAVGGCPSITISFSKEGYYEKTLINPNGDVYLMKK